MDDVLREIQEPKQNLEFSEDERKERLAIMNDIDNDVTPQVGIFWYQDGKLVGVKKYPYDSENTKEVVRNPNSREPKTATINLLHKDYYRSASFSEIHAEPEVAKANPGSAAWTLPKRGRVWANFVDKTFEITVGEWFKDFPEAENKIVKEFNLQDVKHQIIVDKHWNVGSGESGDILA